MLATLVRVQQASYCSKAGIAAYAAQAAPLMYGTVCQPLDTRFQTASQQLDSHS